ncbi:7-carboxy-7-deazaguanine synthase QueE [Candidatus Nitronereus thalassa]|uniref:7-carboxy-7-deazaguanine synthase n=2 Tax=Candidatus Nitronereus thalassa TaxID=3020898 RepID=A0ABU3K889_9BACT|nr:7-carboxy-7-deazaguanine synthase QueE [Candidatus Nitronereus thalassa]MDT7042591.1 7-carboxy-7-deazaguanine synthase QueE [Candidatus Nitronereus thalassa]
MPMNSPKSLPLQSSSSPDSTLRITEIFHSIQGESTFAGEPCVFVRLTGCPLRCTWCDTAYAFHGGTDMSLATVLDQVKSYGCRLVEVTGGEPLSQAAAFPLIAGLCDEGLEVLIETSGAMDISTVDPRAKIILDIKCPGSDMEDRTRWDNLQHITQKDQIKFVISDRRDYDWAVDVVHRHHLADRCPVLFSPVFGGQELRPMAEWILQDRLPVRFQVQLHKFIWNPETRGV